MRLIPAHAGKTYRMGIYLTTPEAHPRSRGENGVLCVVGSAVRGSSPLTRGKLGAESSHSFQRRLIPAHAGKTTRDHRPLGVR